MSISTRQHSENEFNDSLLSFIAISEPRHDYNSTFPPCKIQARFLHPPLGLIALLASFPGSGNTWVRYLLEQSSGILTGSLYYDMTLVKELRGEGVYDGRVLAIKTHGYSDRPGEFDFATQVINFDKAIVIVRHPKYTIISEISRLFTNEDHIKILDEDRWYSEDVQNYMISLAFKWTRFIKHWLLEYLGSLLVVQYESLCSDPLNETNKIMSFLARLPNERGVSCLKIYNEGRFKRKPKSFEPYLNATTIDAINLAVISTSQILKKFDIKYEVIL